MLCDLQRDQAMLEEEKEILEERVKELTIQLEQAQASRVHLLVHTCTCTCIYTHVAT